MTHLSQPVTGIDNYMYLLGINYIFCYFFPWAIRIQSFNQVSLLLSSFEYTQNDILSFKNPVPHVIALV